MKDENSWEGIRLGGSATFSVRRSLPLIARPTSDAESPSSAIFLQRRGAAPRTSHPPARRGLLQRGSLVAGTTPATPPLCAGVDLRADIELCMSTSLRSSEKQGNIALKLHVAKLMFQVFQLFQRYVASILYRYCKSRLGCCTSCNGYTHMFEVYVQNILSVSDIYCKCFIWMLQK
jgi:hypothetical protein